MAKPEFNNIVTVPKAEPGRLVHDPVRRLHQGHDELPVHAVRLELFRAPVPPSRGDNRRELGISGSPAGEMSKFRRPIQ